MLNLMMIKKQVFFPNQLLEQEALVQMRAILSVR